MKTHRKIPVVCFQLLLILGLFLGTQGAVKADQSDEDKVAHQIGNYQKVLEKWLFRQMRSGSQPGQPLHKFHRAYRARKYQKAFELIKPFAERGFTPAQVYLGFMYNNGQGVAKDHTEAAKWYRKAAMLRLTNAQNLLGTMYAQGQGVSKDYVQAYKWFSLVASYSQGREHDEAVRNRNVIKKMMTPAQVAEAQKLVRKWKPKTRKELSQQN